MKNKIKNPYLAKSWNHDFELNVGVASQSIIISFMAEVNIYICRRLGVSRIIKLFFYLKPHSLDDMAMISYKTVNSSPLYKMAAISQTTFPNALSWKKNFEFWLKFHWSLFLKAQLTITQHWFNRRQTIFWANADPIHWRIYAAPGGD